MIKNKVAVLLITLSLSLMIALPAYSYGGRDDSRSTSVSNSMKLVKERDKRSSCRVISKQRAMSQAARGSSGKALSARLHRSGREPYYSVKVVTKSKRVKTVRIRACV